MGQLPAPTSSRSRNEVLQATRDLSFVVAPDSVVALVGESGSGKSVTALAIMGLLPRENAIISREAGVYYGGMNLLFVPPDRVQAVRGKEIAMIFQDPMSALNPVLRVGARLT
jgi:ABC-type dipeptide/oligopeptide/nickel transport system ATPase component